MGELNCGCNSCTSCNNGLFGGDSCCLLICILLLCGGFGNGRSGLGGCDSCTSLIIILLLLGGLGSNSGCGCDNGCGC